jgi:hypothetical protein
MRVQNMVLIGLLGAGVYLLLRNLRERAAVPQPVSTGFQSGGATAGYTQVPESFFKAEQAGSDLYKAYGSVLPSGASRDLIR